MEERPEDHVEDQPDEQKRDEDQPAADEPAFTTHDEYEDDADGDYEDYGEAPEDGEDVAADPVQETISSLVTPRPFEVALQSESKDEEDIGKSECTVFFYHPKAYPSRRCFAYTGRHVGNSCHHL